MEYAQIQTDETSLQITTHGNVEWDENHFCPASALTDDEAALFKVVPLEVTEAPTYDAITQNCHRDGCELLDGVWRYKWKIVALDAETIAANQARAAQQAREAAKAARTAAVEGIIVTTAAGNAFDGDEISQTRMVRAIVALNTTPEVPSVNWVLADNTVIQVAAAELTEALALAGAAQAAIWVI
jgi:surface antigen